MKISCIVPIYNVEKYIYKCMESIFSQTYKDFEVIAIVDGSMDNSEKILRENFEKKENLKIISRENRGLLASRLEGVKMAQGDYIIFVDSDDWIEKDMFEKYVQNIGDYSIIRSNKNIVNEKNKIHPEYIFKKEILNKEEIVKQFAHTYKFNNVTTQMIKKELFENLEINSNISMGEDLLLNINLYERLNEIITIDDCLYNYRLNPNGISKNMKVEKIENNINDTIIVYYELKCFIEKKQKKLVHYAYARIIKEINNEFSKYFYIHNIDKKYIINSLNKIICNEKVDEAINKTNMLCVIKQKNKKILFNICIYKKYINIYFFLGRFIYSFVLKNKR